MATALHVFCRVTDLEDLLQQPSRVLDIEEKEAQKVAADHGQPRRSQLLDMPGGGESLTDISVVPNEPNIIVVSKRGFIKRMPADTINVQNRNGRGAAFSCFVVRGHLLELEFVVSCVSCICVHVWHRARYVVLAVNQVRRVPS